VTQSPLRIVAGDDHMQEMKKNMMNTQGSQPPDEAKETTRSAKKKEQEAYTDYA
jgi:hypothetical protein